MAVPSGGPDGRGQPLNFKIVLLGEGAVGKTSLVVRYVDNKFNDKHISTLQVFKLFLVTCVCCDCCLGRGLPKDSDRIRTRQ